jgi:transcriptional regulator with XRE-family HTH domain
MPEMSFGQRLQEWRRKEGVKPAELARLIQVTPQYVSKLENDRTSPTTGKVTHVGAEILDRIARVLRVPRLTVHMAAYIPELLERDFVTANTRRLVACFEELPAERQEDVIDFTETFWRKYGAKPPTEPKEAA